MGGSDGGGAWGAPGAGRTRGWGEEADRVSEVRRGGQIIRDSGIWGAVNVERNRYNRWACSFCPNK